MSSIVSALSRVPLISGRAINKAEDRYNRAAIPVWVCSGSKSSEFTSSWKPCIAQQMNKRSKVALAASRHPSLRVMAGTGSTDEARKLAVFVSGGGSNMKAIHKAILDGKINGEIVVRISILVRT